MSTRTPKRWPHANQAHAEILPEEKRPPVAVGSDPEKMAPIKRPLEGTPIVNLPPDKKAAPATSSSGPGNSTEERGQAAHVERPAARQVKGLLGPVAFDGTLIVWSMPRTNTRLLIAYKKGTDPQNPLNLFNVLVRENFNFMVGMCVPGPHGKLNVVNNNTYELQGTCPRWRGRW